MAKTIRSSSRTARWLPIVALAVAFGVVSRAQTQEPPEPEAGQPPTFSAGVTLVTTDVIVRDQNGQFIPDLAPEDFIIMEDEFEQEVASLVLVHGGRVFNQLLPPAPTQEGIILPATRPVNDAAGRIFVLFIDDLHLETGLTPRVRQVFSKLAKNLIHEGDMFGIVSTGPSSLAIDMTYDRAMLDVAESRITGDGFSPQELIEQVDEGARGPEELRWRSHVAFKTAREIITNLEEVQNRRKVFIYMSSGYDFNPFANERIYGRNLLYREQRESAALGILDPDQLDSLYDGVPDPVNDPMRRLEQAGAVFSDSDLAMELSELTKAANRANASFYTVDPRGLVAGPSIEHDTPLQEFNEYVSQTQNSLRVLAELTGGMAVVNRNDFDRAFAQIDAETSDYYVLGFYSSNPDPTFRTRRLSVELKREGDYDVRARTHYTYARQSSQ